MILQWKGFAPTIPSTAFVAAGAQVIGDVVLGDHASIWYNCVLRGDAGTIKVGENTNIQDGVILHGTSGRQGAEIGARVSVGHNAIVHACTIQHDVLIGMGATVLDEALVETDVFIAAGALVTPRSHLVSGFLYAGSPAVQKRPLNDMDRAIISFTWQHYAELAREHKENVCLSQP